MIDPQGLEVIIGLNKYLVKYIFFTLVEIAMTSSHLGNLLVVNRDTSAWYTTWPQIGINKNRVAFVWSSTQDTECFLSKDGCTLGNKIRVGTLHLNILTIAIEHT